MRGMYAVADEFEEQNRQSNRLLICHKQNLIISFMIRLCKGLCFQIMKTSFTNNKNPKHPSIPQQPNINQANTPIPQSTSLLAELMQQLESTGQLSNSQPRQFTPQLKKQPKKPTSQGQKSKQQVSKLKTDNTKKAKPSHCKTEEFVKLLHEKLPRQSIDKFQRLIASTNTRLLTQKWNDKSRSNFKSKIVKLFSQNLGSDEGFLVNELIEKFQKCDINRLIDYHIKYITPQDQTLADMQESRMKDSLLLTQARPPAMRNLFVASSTTNLLGQVDQDVQNLFQVESLEKGSCPQLTNTTQKQQQNKTGFLYLGKALNKSTKSQLAAKQKKIEAEKQIQGKLNSNKIGYTHDGVMILTRKTNKTYEPDYGRKWVYVHGLPFDMNGQQNVNQFLELMNRQFGKTTNHKIYSYKDVAKPNQLAETQTKFYIPQDLDVQHHGLQANRLRKQQHTRPPLQPKPTTNPKRKKGKSPEKWKQNKKQQQNSSPKQTSIKNKNINIQSQSRQTQSNLLQMHQNEQTVLMRPTPKTSQFEKLLRISQQNKRKKYDKSYAFVEFQDISTLQSILAPEMRLFGMNFQNRYTLRFQPAIEKKTLNLNMIPYATPLRDIESWTNNLLINAGFSNLEVYSPFPDKTLDQTFLYCQLNSFWESLKVLQVLSQKQFSRNLVGIRHFYGSLRIADGKYRQSLGTDNYNDIKHKLSNLRQSARRAIIDQQQ